MSNATAVAPTDLYRESAAAHGLTGGLNAVGDVEAARFHEEGYLVVEDAFDPSEVAQALDGLTYLMDGGDGEFRGVQYEPSMRDAVADLPVEERRTFVRKVFSFVDHDPRLKAMSGHVPLHRALERIIGAPPVLFQDMALSKPPRMGSEKPWHQDCAYFEFHPDTAVVGVWIALDEATLDNGCMTYVPGSHKHGIFPIGNDPERPVHHIPDTGDLDLPDPVHCPVPVGSLIFHHGCSLHASADNNSASWRKALIFHFATSDSSSARDELNEQVSLEID